MVDDDARVSVHGDLDVVARHDLTVLRQQPGIRIRPRQLGLAALLQLRQIGLHLCPLCHQRRDLLRDEVAQTLDGGADVDDVRKGIGSDSRIGAS